VAAAWSFLGSHEEVEEEGFCPFESQQSVLCIGHKSSFKSESKRQTCEFHLLIQRSDKHMGKSDKSFDSIRQIQIQVIGKIALFF
jgi:hypothetical protein